MPKYVPITEFEKLKIKAASLENRHASAVARTSKRAWSQATDWR
jgi:hypothetical protein